VRRLLITIAALALMLSGVAVARSATSSGYGTATFATTSTWSSGYQAQYTITNIGSTDLSGWTVAFDLPAGTTVASSWDAVLTTTGTHNTFADQSYNSDVAPGASVTFGFVANGTATPAGCTLNGQPCTGGPTPPPTPPGPPPTGSRPYAAPYVDMGAYPTPSLSALAQATGLKGFTMAFITSVGCKASWFNAYDPRTAWQLNEVNAIRAAGGDVKISFGGEAGEELAQACTDVTSLYNEYNAVVNAYSANFVDFDIEGAAVADSASVQRRSQALAMLQQAHPNLKISLTLPVLPTGLDANGLNVVTSAKNAGVNVDIVNVMAMDYYQNGVDYGQAALQAAQATHDQLKTLYPAKTDAQLWAMVGVTPMIGQNDDKNIYSEADAQELVTFAKQHHLGELAFWEETRDANACTGALYKCTNVPQQPYDFSKIFAQYTG
jgi:Cellulose binding domain/Glycosyl hydrolases family 18